MQTTQPRDFHPIGALFLRCGTTRSKAAFGAFPSDRVPLRLTTDEQLMEADRRNARDRRPSQAPLAGVEHTETGSAGHREHAVTFHYVDGTSQYFAPHKR